MGSITRSEKQKAIARTVKRAMEHLNNDPKAVSDAENFGKCEVGIIIKDFLGRLGDFHGVYSQGKFKVRRKLNTDEMDAIVTVTEDAFIGLVRGDITPQYAWGTQGIRVEGPQAYQIMVVGVGIGELLYNVLNE